MAKTIVALFEGFDDARRALYELNRSGIRSDGASVIAHEVRRNHWSLAELSTPYARTGHGSNPDRSGGSSGVFSGNLESVMKGAVHQNLPGIGRVTIAGPIASRLTGFTQTSLLNALLEQGISGPDAELLAEGIRRGGAVILFQAEEKPGLRAQEILKQLNSVDISQRANLWRQRGYKGFDVRASPLTPQELDQERARAPSSSTSSHTAREGAARERTEALLGLEGTRTDAAAGQQQADRRAFVGANVEEGGVDATSSGPKTRWERFDVAQMMAASSGFDRFDSEFQRHHQSTAGTEGKPYDAYIPAYRYGHSLGSDPRFNQGEWVELEPGIRHHWEQVNPGTWQLFQGAVQFAWERSREKLRP